MEAKKRFDLNKLRYNLSIKVYKLNIDSISNLIKKRNAGLLRFDFDVYLNKYGHNLQRGLCWNLFQKRGYINSILKDRESLNPISIIVHENDPNTSDYGTVYIIIDGKQRLNCIFDFIDNKFSIVQDNNEYFFRELPVDTQNIFLFWHLESNVAYSYWDNEINDDEKIKWFLLLNYTGTRQEEERELLLKSDLKIN